MAQKCGMLIQGPKGSVKELKLVRWKDGSSLFKKGTVLCVVRFVFDNEVFSPRFPYDPAITAISLAH